MAAVKRKPADAFAAHVERVSAKADRKALGKALGKLTKARLTKPAPRLQTAKQIIGDFMAARTERKQRRSPRRLGRYRSYTVTDKPDVSRLGTFRHYLISTIRRYNNTLDAATEHANCDNPSWAKNKLDFNWAADNGYITFD